jgi:excisionase family DNA binding protein
MQIISERVTGLEGYLTLEEAAHYVGMSYWQLRRLVVARSIPCKALGHSLLVPLSAVQREAARK